MDKWNHSKLEDICLMRNGKKSPDSSGKFKVYGGNGVMGTTCTYNAENVIVVGRVGAYCGNVYLCQDKCWVSDNAIIVEPTKDVDISFLYYLMSSLNLNRRHTGAAQPLMTQDIIGKFDIRFPSIETQTRIASVLSHIDKKITLNRQINDNLEALARQLYDYWFVQFDFPDENGKPYKSSGGKMVWNEKLKREIPEGWTAHSIFDELSVQYGFPFSTELFSDNKIGKPVVRIRDILNNTVSAYSTEDVDDKYKLQKGDLLIGMDGNFHMNYWGDNVSYLNQRSVRLRSKAESTVSIVQAKYDIAPYIKAKEANSKGSTVGHLSDKDLKELYVIACPNQNFKMQFDNILSSIISNREEIVELTKQRNELLPLLMNGQVTVL